MNPTRKRFIQLSLVESRVSTIVRPIVDGVQLSVVVLIFDLQVLDFGWPDHLAPSLERLSSVCRSMKSWLDSDPQHVVVVHCKGGKGRTGCVIAAFMNYSEICHRLV